MYDPNATLVGIPQGQNQGQNRPQQQGGYDPNATLIGTPMGGNQGGYYQDPNATLVGVPQGGNAGYYQQQQGGYDPNATLIGTPMGGGAGYDPNATLVGTMGGAQQDPNATLIGGGGPMPMFVNNSAHIQMHAQMQPQIIPRIRLVPHNPYFPVMEREVTKTLKFGRQGETAETDPDFVSYQSRVVSRRHAEIWCVNGEFYIRDTKSQTGTFLNAMRLSLPGEESKPFKLKNGDTIQLGVDRKGGTTPDTKCVSVVCELSFTKNTPQPQQQQYQQPYQQQYQQQPQQYQQQQQQYQQQQQFQQQFQQYQQGRPLSKLSDLTLVNNPKK